MAFRRAQKHIDDKNTLTNIMRESKIVKCIEAYKKCKSKFAKYKLTNDVIVIRCRGKKHESKFEIRVEVKKKCESKKIRSQVDFKKI